MNDNTQGQQYSIEFNLLEKKKLKHMQEIKYEENNDKYDFHNGISVSDHQIEEIPFWVHR